VIVLIDALGALEGKRSLRPSFHILIVFHLIELIGSSLLFQVCAFIRLFTGLLVLKTLLVESLGFKLNIRELLSCPRSPAHSKMQRSCNSLVICGPSGVGKGAVKNALQRRYPHLFGYSVSHTTRNPRINEVNGIDYHFVTKKV
jgi:hypothetical protein